jgi:hypothetical protein
MSVRFRTLLVLAPLVLPFAAARAQAAPVWTATANSCVVDNSDLGDVEQDSFSLQHRKFVKGAIVARCNLTNPLDSGADPGWGTLEVVYRDPDGRDNRSTVRVRVIRVNNGGNTTNVAEFSSDDFPEAVDPTTESVTFSHAFDFDHGAYYVELRINRESTRSENDPAVWLVRLK